MAKAFNVAGATFPTKKSITEYVRSILNGSPELQPLGPADFRFMGELLKSHPDSIQTIVSVLAKCGLSKTLYSAHPRFLARAAGREQHRFQLP